MKKTANLLTVIALFFCIRTSAFPYPELIADKNLHETEIIRKASRLTMILVMAEKQDKDKILEEFRMLTIKNPDSSIIKNMYINNLIAAKHYQEGLDNLNTINKNNLTRTNLLTECMLRERLGIKDENCYKEVIFLSEKDNIVDSDYISALFFSDDQRFEPLKLKLIKENKFKESDFLVFTSGKEKMLYEFFP
ncbi:hypothetical protein [Erwinia mallotivora]|uniref:Uncharacterized protein n=1 Tax=Erwinia mallotivora TaxID=69222 RepID=A0A014PZQ0_9GAMM|nr:hypothetical protein [Erwinia mallotivora]EXU76457.1 hypothetical protein BG55_05310 [Erwinia mallotivora]